MNHMGWVCCYKFDCCFIKVLLISLPDLCARDFCIPPVKIFQMKLSMAMRWALNKNQYRTVPSRRIITCACSHISEKFFYTAKNTVLCRCSDTIPLQHKPAKRGRCAAVFPLLWDSQKSWGLGTDLHYKHILILQKLFLDNHKFDRHILAGTYLFKDWKIPVSCLLLNWLKIFLLCIRWRERKHQNHLHQIWYSLYIHVNPVGQGKTVEKSTEVISIIFQLRQLIGILYHQHSANFHSQN